MGGRVSFVKMNRGWGGESPTARSLLPSMPEAMVPPFPRLTLQVCPSPLASRHAFLVVFPSSTTKVQEKLLPNARPLSLGQSLPDVFFLHLPAPGI